MNGLCRSEHGISDCEHDATSNRKRFSHEHLKCISRINRNSLKVLGCRNVHDGTGDADPAVAGSILSNPSLLTPRQSFEGNCHDDTE
jgi:hypothetical protein